MAVQWPIEERGLDELDLDLRNVRIPGGDLDEAAIANYLVEAADLLDMVRDILRDGYLDNELPVVVIEGERCVVLEGNRRITALKAIRDPALLGKSAPRVERLLSRYSETVTPAQVRVMVAPSREAAQPLLARLHTRNPKKSWLREQQAVFYHAQMSSTVTVNDLRTTYPGEASSIASFIRMGEMRELIRSMRYDDPSLEEFVKTSQLKMTSFEYAYDLPKIQQALGLSFDRDGLLTSKRLSEGQRRGLMYLLDCFRAKTLNTRSPELRAKNDLHDPFAEQLRQLVAGEADGTVGSLGVDAENPDTSDSDGHLGDAPSAGTSGGAEGREPTRSGSASGGTAGVQPDGTSGSPSAAGGTSATGQSGLRGPNRGETRSRLDIEGFEYKGSSPGLRRRLEELKRLDVRDFPNAAHDLLRTALECAIKDHFVSTQQQRLTGKQLGGCISELAAVYRNDQRMTSLINAINRRGAMPASQYAGTAASLNASNHEPDSFVTGKDVHEAWDRIKPILIEIVGT